MSSFSEKITGRSRLEKSLLAIKTEFRGFEEGEWLFGDNCLYSIVLQLRNVAANGR